MSAYAYLIGWRIVRFLPERIAYRLFYLIGDYVYRKNGKGVRRLRSNMQQVSNLTGQQLESLT
ncbi:MAG: phosphatidylinositol mannoside acyltransferase, partial [Candidatus Nanopelagicaceae bacterium]